MKSFVKITAKGKVSILLQRSQKYAFKRMLEAVVHGKWPNDLTLTMATAGELTRIALMDELYRKYYTELDLLNGEAEVKIILSRGQAYALWSSVQESAYFPDITFGNILLQLHQKLS